MRAFAYLRLSRDRDTSTSIEKQRDGIADYCRHHGITVTEWFEETDVSGTTESRRRYQAMLKRLDEVDVIIFWALDRVIRNAHDLWKLRERCRTAGVRYINVTKQFPDDTMGEMFETQMAYFGQMEAEATGDRMRATHDRLLRLGKPVSRARAFGWRQNPTTKAWEHVPDEIAVIRTMVEAYLSGAGVTAIARGLTDGSLCGAPVPATKGGTGWSPSVVRCILESPRLIGFMVWRGGPATDTPTLPPVIDVATYERLQAELRSRKRAGVRMRWPEHGELTGLLVCATCRRRMYMNRSTWGSWTYGCSGTLRHSTAIAKGFVEDHVASRLFGKVDARILAETEQARTADAVDPHQELRATVARLEWGRDELDRDFYQERRIERDAYDVQRAEIADRLDVARAKLEAAQDTAAIVRAHTASGGLEVLWEHLSAAERRTIYRAWIEAVEVAPARSRGVRPSADRVNILWRPP